MAKASALITGSKVTVNSGPFENQVVTVIDPEPIPDGGDHRSGAENQRKVLVSLDNIIGPDDQPTQTYILPRLLNLGTPQTIDATYVDYQATVPALVHADLRIMQEATPITDPMDPALDRFRPNVSVIKRYIRRTVPGGYSDVDYLLHLREQRDANGYSPNVALVGDTQSGKTMLVEVLAVLAAERDGMPKPYPVFTINGSSGVTNYDIFGQTSAVIINGREVLVWMEGLAAMAAKAGGFLYLDEWNAVPPASAVSLHPLLDERRQFVNTQKAVPDGHGGFSPEIVHANTGLWVISTINPGYKGTQTMAEATSNRFRWIPWDYDEDVEKALVPSKSVRLIGNRLREALAARQVTVPVGTSALMRLNSDCAQFGVDTALWTFQGLFPPAERDRVEVIIGDGGLLDLLKDEYPTAMFRPNDSTTTVQVGSTWSDDAISQQV